MVSIDTHAVQWSLDEGERAGKPLMLLLHGLGSHEDDLVGLVPFLPPEFVYASLRAPLPYGGGWSWYPLSQPGAPEYAPVDDAADAVVAFIDALPSGPSGAAHPSVGLLGFSQGGSLSLQLLRKRPEFFDFAVVLAGFVVPGGSDAVDDAVAAVLPPVFYGHGDADQVIPAAAVERTSAWLAAHTAVEESVYPGLTHGISNDELDDVTAFLARVHPVATTGS